ncbi:MAG: NusA-like transcription termination signal-binding factor [Candidatus Aenigmatarchaeota archaeon]|nr:MAG: NusA-like transcription termination signal-binding factor [Candidatus Aenigmarchaeota archaeon]
MAVKLGIESIRTIALFEKITNVHARDCLITEDCVYFLVDPEKIGLAIGKNGAVIKDVRKMLGRQVKLFGYYDKPEEMIKNMVPNIKNMSFNDGKMIISIPSQDKVAVIGKNGRNIKAIKEIMKRHFSINYLKLR